MLDAPYAEQFALDWIGGWNRRDLEGALAYFADDAVFTSPLAAAIVPESGGVIRGKDALREYWRAGLQSHRDLHFDHLCTSLGVDTIAVTYGDHTGGTVTEIFRFSDQLIIEGHTTRRIGM